jgi:hypothetical protein
MLSSPENFQLPLYASLAISPICLLMSTTLFDKCVGKEHLLDVRRFSCLLMCISSILQFWLGLGNQRPDALEKIERVLWGILLGTINDPDKLPTLLQTGLEPIDTDELGQLDDQASGLFRAGEFTDSKMLFPSLAYDREIGPALATFNEDSLAVGETPPRVREEEAGLPGVIEDEGCQVPAVTAEQEPEDPHGGTANVDGGNEKEDMSGGPSCQAAGADSRCGREDSTAMDEGPHGGATSADGGKETASDKDIHDGPRRSGRERKPAAEPSQSSNGTTSRPKKRKRPAGNQKPKKKSKQSNEEKPDNLAQNPNLGPNATTPVEPRPYFEMINDGGVMKIVEMTDLTGAFVSPLRSWLHL